MKGERVSNDEDRTRETPAVHVDAASGGPRPLPMEGERTHPVLRGLARPGLFAVVALLLGLIVLPNLPSSKASQDARDRATAAELVRQAATLESDVFAGWSLVVEHADGRSDAGAAILVTATRLDRDAGQTAPTRDELSFALNGALEFASIRLVFRDESGPDVTFTFLRRPR